MPYIDIAAIEAQIKKTIRENKEQVLEGTPLSKKNMRSIAYELRAELEKQFAAVVRTPYAAKMKEHGISLTPTFGDSDNVVSYEIEDIGIDLFRPSLYAKRTRNWSGGYTGDGVDDIFALFTQGYMPLRKQPYGLWRKMNRHVHASIARAGVKFAPRAAEIVERRHGNMFSITLPDEWT